MQLQLFTPFPPTAHGHDPTRVGPWVALDMSGSEVVNWTGHIVKVRLTGGYLGHFLEGRSNDIFRNGRPFRLAMIRR